MRRIVQANGRNVKRELSYVVREGVPVDVIFGLRDALLAQ